MRGFGAMCLLRRCRCMFLAPQCAALRCPWMSSPCSARGACPFLCPWSAWCFVYCTSAHVQQNCTVVQYKKKGRTPTNERTNEPRTKFHLIERITTTGSETEKHSCMEVPTTTLVYGGPNHHLFSTVLARGERAKDKDHHTSKLLQFHAFEPVVSSV